jgi:Fe-S cluster biogenesis protein NfuA
VTELKKKISEVLHNVNWMLEAHESFAELVGINGNKVIIRSTGFCSECETNCVETAFKEQLPDIELVFQ